MKKKQLETLELKVINEGRISKDNMFIIKGGTETCDIHHVCHRRGKNACEIYRLCSWFLNKSTCDFYYYNSPT